MVVVEGDGPVLLHGAVWPSSSGHVLNEEVAIEVGSRVEDTSWGGALEAYHTKGHMGGSSPLANRRASLRRRAVEAWSCGCLEDRLVGHAVEALLVDIGQSSLRDHPPEGRRG